MGNIGRLPKVIASSVIRSSHKGESHGGVYIVDLEQESSCQVIDWNDGTISWEGRGADRGLRGIAISQDHIFLAASDEILVYNSDLELVQSYRNRYLKHCHEIAAFDDTLFLTSTGYDSVLEFNLRARRFVRGYCLRYNRYQKRLRKLRLGLEPAFTLFDPNREGGPHAGDTTHVNNVYCWEGCLFISGLHLGYLYGIRNHRPFRYARVPFGVHNAQPFREGVLLNDTNADRVAYLDRRGRVAQSFPITHYDESEVLMSHLPNDHARQGFARGLCTEGDELIISGSSPATISAFRFGGPCDALRTLNISMDIRNSIHGLEIWPF
jgi:hypothetical protein